MQINNISVFPVREDEFGDSCVEIPVSFNMKVYVDVPEGVKEVAAAYVLKTLSNMDLTRLGETLLEDGIHEDRSIGG